MISVLMMLMFMHKLLMFIFIPSFGLPIPTAAQLLVVLTAVFAIMTAAKASPWLSQYLNGWVSVTLNIVLTVLGLVIAVPANQLYTWPGLVALIVTVLGSSGIHGMVTNVPPTKPVPPVIIAPPGK